MCSDMLAATLGSVRLTFEHLTYGSQHLDLFKEVFRRSYSVVGLVLTFMNREGVFHF